MWHRHTSDVREKLKLTRRFLLDLFFSFSLNPRTRCVCTVAGVFVLTDVKSGGFGFKQKKTVFIHSDAFHTKIKLPDWLGKALFWQLLAKIHRP